MIDHENIGDAGDLVTYDPRDLAQDIDPWARWARLREKAPLYHNEDQGFFALSRFVSEMRGPKLKSEPQDPRATG